jgi:hypothetical protein
LLAHNEEVAQLPWRLEDHAIMWAPLALASALSLAPGQAGDLKLVKPRATYGILGQDRPDAKLLPGDILYVSFDIDGLKVKDDGKISYSMAMELINKTTKKNVFTKDPQDLEGINTLGGSRVPAFALTEIGLDTPPGDYTLKVIVEDRANEKKKASFTYDFEVLKPAFGFARVGLMYDTGAPAPPVAVAGQTLIITFALVGFELKTPKDAKDPKIKQPNIDYELSILEGARPTLPKPFSFSATEAEEKFKRLLPTQFIAQLNRSGTFKVKIKATDKIAGKSVETTLDLVVK